MEVFFAYSLWSLYSETSQQWTSQIADMQTKYLVPNVTIFFKLPPNSGHLSITDKFFQTRRCPLCRGFTILHSISYCYFEILQIFTILDFIWITNLWPKKSYTFLPLRGVARISEGLALRINCPNTQFFLVVFSRIWTP